MASFVTIDGDPETLVSAFDDELSEMLDDVLEQNAEYYAETLREITPQRTGDTAASIYVEGSDLEYAVGSDSPVLGFLDEGTSDHDVYPVEAQALHWTEGGTQVGAYERGTSSGGLIHVRGYTRGGTDRFAKSVHVSGIVPMDLFENALDMAEPAMDANMELYMDAAWQKAADASYGVEDFE